MTSATASNGRGCTRGDIMKRLATLVLAASFVMGALAASVERAPATPFADVPANHWAYQAVASLAADGLIEGYSDGKFKGDRPLSRYEMAVLVARVIAKVQANGAGYASKVDLDKLQKLIDALKDELDSLGVRVANVEDALDALDKRTKLAQSLQLHGDLFHNFSERQSVTYPHTVSNGTGVPQTLYYGGAVPASGSATVDPFVDAFLRSPENNSPLEQATLTNYLRFDDRINLAYTVNENLMVSFPIHILNYESGGAYTPNAKYSVQPNILINIARSGNITNLYLRFGELDDLRSSRVGLTYRAPDPAEQGPGFEYPIQSYQKGVQIGGTLNGFTDIQINFSQVDTTLINTQLNVLDSSGGLGLTNYFYYVNRPPTTYVQPGAPGSTSGALQSNTFTSGNGSLAQVYLAQKAQLGSVYISQYDGSHFNNAAARTGGVPGGPAAPPAFLYNDNYNSVVFGTPLPPGSSVTITYVGLTVSNQADPQRYNLNLRVNQKIKGLPGAEVGLSFNRLFDADDTATPAGITNVGLQDASGYGLVSDSVLGVDAQVPLRFLHIGGDRAQFPMAYGEIASSKYTPDYRSVASVSDAAGVVGLRLKIFAFTASVQYQSVGANFLDGAPLRYFGNTPALFSYYDQNYFPGFFGFANNAAVNAAYDAVNGTCSGANKTNCTSQNPNLTFIYPVFNPFVASGSQFFSAFAPNTSGVTLNVGVPVKIAGLTINARLLGQHLAEITPDYAATQFYAPYVAGGLSASTKRMTMDKVEAGAQFNLPLFKQSVGIHLAGSVERLSRPDKTVFNYVPLDPATLTSTLGGTGVPFYPNYTDMYHTTVAAAASVPLTKDVIFGASYNTQGFHGAYGTTVGQNISERKDTYVGSITYNIPRTTSSVAFALRNYRYTDFTLPSFNTNENKEDINFVIRF
jgi:hypothetical protein